LRLGRRGRRLSSAAVVAVTTAAAAGVTVAISQEFSRSSDVTGFRSFTLAGTLLDLPASAGRLASHLARLSVGVTAPAALALGALLVAIAARRRLSAAAWWSLGFAAAILAEVFVLNPDWLQGSQPRLASLAVPPLVAAAGWLLAELEHGKTWSWTVGGAGLACAGITIASLHHHYTVLRPVSTAGGFLLLECVGAAAILTPFARRALALHTARQRIPPRVENAARRRKLPRRSANPSRRRFRRTGTGL
jgi:hypothetical protein